MKVQGALDVVDYWFTSVHNYNSKLVRRNVLQLRHWKIEGINVNRYNIFPIVMGWISIEGLVMVRKWAIPRTCVLLQYENKIETIVEINSWNLLGEDNSKNVQRPSQNDHLHINEACVGMPTWKIWTKPQSLGLICSLLGKVGKTHFIQYVIVPNHKLHKNIPYTSKN